MLNSKISSEKFVFKYSMSNLTSKSYSWKRIAYLNQINAENPEIITYVLDGTDYVRFVIKINFVGQQIKSRGYG